MLRPVWLYVNYQSQTIANAYAQGNPILYWVGIVATIFVGYFAIKNKNGSLKTVLFSYLLFFTPWAFSPRIMFLYHFLPATPFLAIIVAWFLLYLVKSGRPKLAASLLFAIAFSFFFFYPNVTSIPIPTKLDPVFFLLPSWK